MGRRSRRDRRRRRRRWAGPSTARHSNRQAEERLDVSKHGMGQFGAKRRGHRGDWRRSGGGLRVPVDGESARVYRTGMHAAGGKSEAGTRTGGTTRGSNRRCGQTGDNCAMHADIVHTRFPQRRASISDARHVRGGSLAGRRHLRQFEVQSPLSGRNRRPASPDVLELGLQIAGGSASRSSARAASCAHRKLACASAMDVGDSPPACASTRVTAASCTAMVWAPAASASSEGCAEGGSTTSGRAEKADSKLDNCSGGK